LLRFEEAVSIRLWNRGLPVPVGAGVRGRETDRPAITDSKGGDAVYFLKMTSPRKRIHRPRWKYSRHSRQFFTNL
jgi:hypothetical protein